jgi:hypothetical protein
MDSEQHRHECECRYWLEDTKGSKPAVDARMARIAKKRGQRAADRLRDGMRAEYAMQRGVK